MNAFRPLTEFYTLILWSHSRLAPLLIVTLLVFTAGAQVGPDPSLRLKVEITRPELQSVMLEHGGQRLADYGSYELWDLPPDQRTAIEGLEGVSFQEGEDVLELNSGAIPTQPGMARAAATAAVAFTGRQLRLVQFAGPIHSDWHSNLIEAGFQVVTYVPRNAYLVYGDTAALKRMREVMGDAAYLQWEGVYLPQHKMHPVAQAAMTAPDEEGVNDLFAIQLVEDQEPNAETLQLFDAIRREWVSQSKQLGYLNCILRLPPARLSEVAARPDVVSIHPYVRPEKRDERQAQILAGNLTGNLPSGPGYLAWLTSKGFTAAQFAASGFAVDVSDSGIDNGTQFPGHFGLYTLGDSSFSSRVAYNRLLGTPNPGSTIQACDGHGNINAHIIGGFNDLAGFPHTDAAGYHYGLGICPFVRVGSSVIFDPDTFTFPNYATLQSRAYQDGSRVSCNSWGASLGGAYNIDCQIYDALVRDAQPSTSPFPTAGNQEMVIVFAAGNSGPGANSVGVPGGAKNIISVGAAENVHSHSTANGGNNTSGNDGCAIADTGADSANDIIFFSSRGPCDDGRIKPDLMGPGTHVTGGVGQEASPGPNGTALACFRASGVCALSGGGTVGNPNNFFPLGQQFFTTSAGTSHSCPAVGGGAALLRQYFINQNWPAPSPAMTKGWLMNSARRMTGTGANDTLPSNNQGMGSMNLGMAFDGAPRVQRDQKPEDRFTATGQSRSFEGFISDPSKPLRVTLAWTDAPGSTAGNAYNNNLNLTVTVGGQVYRGNVFSGGVSVPGGSADPRNNVESVFLPAGLSGAYVITVTAANINSDGVPNNGSPLDQDFALVIYNSSGQPVRLVPAGAVVEVEGCSPGQGAIDPGEAVTVAFSVRNVGPSNTTVLAATLLPTGGVVSPGAPQSYGVVTGNSGPAVARSFTFTAAGECGGQLIATLHLQDGTNDYGLLQFPFRLGRLVSNDLAFSNSAAITINAASGAVAPYPSSISVSGAGLVSKATVMLHGFSHSWPDDIDVVLVGPQGQSVLLLSDAGGDNGANNLSLTFDSAAAATLPDESPLASGAWKPTDFEDDAVFPGPAPAPPYGNTLSAFVGTDPNGSWQLFVTDDYASDDGGEIPGGWTLTLATTNSVCCMDAGSADLAVTVNDAPDPVSPMDAFAYTITVSNAGPAMATSATLVTTLPSDVTYLSGTTSQGSLTRNQDTVTGDLSSIAPGGTVTVTLTVRAVAGPELVCSNIVSAIEPDPNVLNNKANVTTTVLVPALVVEDASVVEGDTNDTVAVFLVTLSRPAAQVVKVSYYTTNGTAIDGPDYSAGGRQLNFAVGQVSKTIHVPVLGDGLDEANETFGLVLTDAENASLGDAQAVGIILDDDPGPTLSIGDAAVVEGDSGTNSATFSISLSAVSGRSVGVWYSTTNGSAVAGTDYQSALNQAVTFAPGQTLTNIAVRINGDTQIETNEAFFVRLQFPTNATVADGLGVGTIVTDDLAAVIAAGGFRVVSESGGVTNDLLDFGETVTVSIALRNEGSIDTTNLVATLQAGGGVVAPSDPQTYGVLAPGGLQVSRQFTFTVGTPTCETLTMTLTLQDGAADLGSVQFNNKIGNCFFDDFDPDIDLPLWSSFGGGLGIGVIATNHGGSISGSNSLWFGGSSPRSATTIPIDTHEGGIISFYLRLANSSLGGIWESVDLPAEGVVLEYSTNGISWVQIGVFDTPAYYSWTFVSRSIPALAQSPATRFRWRQLSHSGSCCDHWALDDVLVRTGPQPPLITSHPANQIAAVGGTAAFTVDVSGSVPLSYQWRFHGTNLAGATNAALTLGNVQTNQAGPYSVHVSNAYGSAVSSNATLTVVQLAGDDFQIVSLRTNNSRVVDHDAQTGDDRGGIAASHNRVFYTGDGATARFQLSDLSGGASVGQRFDALVSDLRSGQVYSFASGLTPLTSSGGTATTLVEHDPNTGALTTNRVTLSQPITLSSIGNIGIFAGYGRVLVHTGARVYAILLPSGLVQDLGAMGVPSHMFSESWAYWGMAEHWAGSNYLVYVRDSQNIVRTRVPDGLTTVLAGFTSLSDMACITVSVPLNRWYFHHEGGSQFGGQSETIGYADAILAYGPNTNPPTILTQPASQTADLGTTVAFSVVVGGSPPLSYQWRFNSTNLSGANGPQLTLANVNTGHSGPYTVVVTNAYGAVTSSVAVLTINLMTNLVISVADSGWYSAPGFHNPGNDNYICGNLTGLEHRNWFIFNLPAIPNTLQAAQLRLNSFNVVSSGTDETYVLRHVSTPVAALQAGGSGLSNIFTDLADGVSYGSRNVLVSEANQFIFIPLNAAFLTNAFNATGGAFAIAGHLTSLQGVSTTEYLFGSSGGTGNNIQLILQFGPPPSVSLSPRLLPDGSLELWVENAPNDSLNPMSATGVRVYYTADLTVPFTEWQPLTNPMTLTNGTLRIEGLNVSDAPARFFRVEYAP